MRKPSWLISKIPPLHPGRTWSMASSTSTTQSDVKSTLNPPGNRTNSRRTPLRSSFVPVDGTSTNPVSSSITNPSQAPYSILPSTSSIMLKNSSLEVPDHISTYPRWSTIKKRGCGTTSSSLRRAISGFRWGRLGALC